MHFGNKTGEHETSIEDEIAVRLYNVASGTQCYYIHLFSLLHTQHSVKHEITQAIQVFNHVTEIEVDQILPKEVIH